MAATRYTPGPWRVWSRNAEQGGPLITDRDGAVGIARVIRRMRDQKEFPVEADANANLIAAAPDLLAACEKLLAELERWIADELPSRLARGERAELEYAREAIAKATGETPGG